MFTIFVAYFLLLDSEASVRLDVSTAAGDSTVLPCSLMNTTPTKNLRFYWQDQRQNVLYSFNKGQEMAEHVNELYRDRITAFPQEMTTGNISVRLENATLEDNLRVFQVFAAVFESSGPRRYSVDHRQICQITLHVAVPYRSVSLTVNEEAMTAVCTTHRGFPEPLVGWTLQFLRNDSRHFVELRDVRTTAVQDRRDHLYSVSSEINVSGGPYRSVTCLIHNPTLNVTLSSTQVLNKGGAERSLPVWAAGLMAAVILLLSAAQ